MQIMLAGTLIINQIIKTITSGNAVQHVVLPSLPVHPYSPRPGYYETQMASLTTTTPLLLGLYDLYFFLFFLSCKRAGNHLPAMPSSLP